MKNINLDLTKKLKSVRYGESLRPSRDWLVVLSVAILLIVGSVIWNLSTFTKVTEGIAIGNESAPPLAERIPLESVTALFEMRALEEARYMNEYQFVDPSSRAR